MLFQNVFKCHCWHSTFASRNDVFAFQIVPIKVRFCVAPNKERAVASSQLSKNNRCILHSVVAHINCAFWPHQTNISVVGNQTGHHSVASASVGQFNFKAFFFKIAFVYCHIHWGIKQRMCYFTDAQCIFVLLFAASASKQHCKNRHDGNKHNSNFFHQISFLEGFKWFYASITHIM